MTAGLAWYDGDRRAFLGEAVTAIVGQLASAATQHGLHIEPEQHDEWTSSVGLLKSQLADRVEVLRSALVSPELGEYSDVILEYDFRRRGLRLDCVLLGNGVLVVIEFKRSTLTAADRDQVTNYCINLLEFHEETRRACAQDGFIVVPMLALTQGSSDAPIRTPEVFNNAPWGAVVRDPICCDASTLHMALVAALQARRGKQRPDRKRWLSAKFAPSSTILDAAISLYGHHDVSAISAHAAPIELIERCTTEVGEVILRSQQDRRNRVIFVSGAPGAGKTLVGLKLTFDPRFQKDAVFVTGNAPLVDVLTAALHGSYRSSRRRSDPAVNVLSGYAREDAHAVERMATFKIVKAHAFLGERGKQTGSADGRIVVFDEAQRTYAKGKEVLRKKLEDNEADLILDSMTKSYGDGAVVVALVGHNQAINRGESGIVAWFQAAKAKGWRYAISDETLALSELEASGPWATDPAREVLQTGHLPHSLRYYRNSSIERWASAVLEDDPGRARAIAESLPESDTIWLCRDLASAKAWVRERRVGDERIGIIASGQARRLAAEGLFVDLKPDIAKWMLAPSGDIRSSNMLETVQNQYQIQGLEIDYAIVCWDADLRRSGVCWESYKINGADWNRDGALDIAKNGYRVLLTWKHSDLI